MNHFDGDQTPNDPTGDYTILGFIVILSLALIPFYEFLWNVFALPFK